MTNNRRNFIKCMTTCCLAASLAPLGVSAREQEQTKTGDEKMTPENRGDKALAYMNEYGSCCTGVLAAFAEEEGLDVQLAAEMGRGMAGGIGSMGNVCGAVSGAVMVIGLKTTDANNVHDMPSAMQTIDKAQEFFARFEEKHKSIICRELIGHDINTPEERMAAMKENVFVNCPSYVRDAATIVDEMFSDKES